ncbi:MAG: type II/IV secretion system protein [Magnetococcales bacterium]|nr:type II/IV secretion system protein [Magnetococcales bacterium]
MSQEKKRKPIGELLREKNLINEGHIQISLQEQQVTSERLGEALQRLGFVSEFDVGTTIAQQEGRTFIDVDQVVPEEATLRLFNENLCLSNHFLPMNHTSKEVEIVTSSDEVDQLETLITRNTGLRPIFNQGESDKIHNMVRHYYFFLENPVDQLLQQEIRILSTDVAGTRSVDKFIEYLFQLAIKERASDIHVRPLERSINIAFRVDGVVRSMFSVHPSFRRIISTLKMKAEMNIAEKRLPQDGSFTEMIMNNRVDFRVSTTVCIHGENMVLRVLPNQTSVLGISQLGLFEEDLQAVRSIFQEPFGLVLVTGPTGSGKTTTLFSVLRSLDLTDSNVITVEDPIEFRLPLVRQTQVNAKAGYDFANAVRYFLRHDPDIIMVGEVRDKLTAEVAMSASETGHLVLSTLHTNTALGALPRLRSLDVPPFMLADSLVAILCQRLVRRNCSVCRESYPPTPEDLAYLKDHTIDKLYRGKGCKVCGQSGFFGRTVIYELFIPDQALTNCIYRDEPLDVIESMARKKGFFNLFECAVKKVKCGETTLSEVRRVLGASYAGTSVSGQSAARESQSTSLQASSHSPTTQERS